MLRVEMHSEGIMYTRMYVLYTVSIDACDTLDLKLYFMYHPSAGPTIRIHATVNKC